MNWIWLDEKIYPEYRKNYPNVTGMSPEERAEYPYCVAQFKKDFAFGKKISRAVTEISADNFFHLFINGEFTGIGPAAAGGDFLCECPAPKHYFNTYETEINSDTLSFDIHVRLLSQKLTDYSRGCGGAAVKCKVFFCDGTETEIGTDESWLCRRISAYAAPCEFNSLLPESEFCNAVNISDRWHAEKAPIPMLSFNEVFNNKFTVPAGETLTEKIELDRIYGVYPVIKASGGCRVTLKTRELCGQQTDTETAVFGGEGEYYSFIMHSAGEGDVKIENTSAEPVNVKVFLVATWYPVEKQGKFVCSDEKLNRVYDVCAHTLKICRQTLHLDSTKHQELLACTGDYYIESLITLYMFGDMRLAEFDVMRTADWLKKNNGRIFHTTYSLIWVRMLLDTYTATGRKELLTYCKAGLDALLARFDTYLGGSGLVENPPDYMFVDWTVIDGYSMHHPPKALGQTALNAFYYGALINAEKVYALLGEKERAAALKAQAEKFKVTFNTEFFDEARGMYFDGKNDEYEPSHWLPENSEKKYFSKYPNILACLYGLCEGENAERLLEKVMFDSSLQDIQPYFMHYAICAVRKLGLFPKFGMQLLDRWKPLAEECSKGLKEGWIAPEETYSFDHSHAWGGTIAYQLPSAISGMKVLEAGMKKLSFDPELYGLEYADIDIPVNSGIISLRLKRGCAPEITAPADIEITYPKNKIL